MPVSYPMTLFHLVAFEWGAIGEKFLLNRVNAFELSNCNSIDLED